MNRVPLEDCIQSERRSGLIRPQWRLFGLMKNYDGVLHPFMFAAYAVLSMYANNLGEVVFGDVRRALLFALVGACLLLLLLRLACKEWGRAAIVTTLALIVFFSYGHFYAWIKDFQLGRAFGRHRFLLPLYALLLVGLSWVLGRTPQRRAAVNRFLNTVGLVALAFPVFAIVGYALQTRSAERFLSPSDPPPNLEADPVSGENPDVYYIVLDGYARADVLSELYDFDNSDFENALRELGFTIASTSTSNYSQTHLSLTSTLNMQYLDELAAAVGENSTNMRPLSAVYRSSAVRAAFESLGYQIVAFENGYGMMELYDADLYMTAYDVPVDQDPLYFIDATINAFESQLLDTTALRAALDLISLRQAAIQRTVIDPAYQSHRNRVLYTFDHLADVARMEGDYFVVAHIVAPHPPFVFGPNGEEIFNARGYSMADGDAYVGTPDYADGYRDQLSFVNTMAVRTLTEILESSSVPPIIVLQADHGPGARLQWESVEETDLRERMSILNAYYLPGVDPGELYPSITPVNSFRLIFNLYFGTGYRLLEDENFFSSPTRPYDLLKVTDQVQDG